MEAFKNVVPLLNTGFFSAKPSIKTIYLNERTFTSNVLIKFGLKAF